MLILRRLPGEALILSGPSGEIRILVSRVDTRTGRVKLGIEAPAEVHVVREELLARTEGMECSTRAISTVGSAENSVRNKENHTTGSHAIAQTGGE